MNMSKVKQKTNPYAFIDSQNLNLGVRDAGWLLDFARFRVYLKDKYKVQKAFLFIGYVVGNESLYTSLQSAGYICIFKPTLELPGGKTKGNVDAELVLQTMIEYKNFDKAIIVSGDGDFYCLVEYLLENGKLGALLVPNRKKYSGLLKREDFVPYTRFVSDQKNKLQKRKTPAKTDGHRRGTLPIRDASSVDDREK
jgi:uncharacterized LabA/DUF88 family protein